MEFSPSWLRVPILQGARFAEGGNSVEVPNIIHLVAAAVSRGIYQDALTMLGRICEAEEIPLTCMQLVRASDLLPTEFPIGEASDLCPGFLRLLESFLRLLESFLRLFESFLRLFESFLRLFEHTSADLVCQRDIEVLACKLHRPVRQFRLRIHKLLPPGHVSPPVCRTVMAERDPEPNSCGKLDPRWRFAERLEGSPCQARHDTSADEMISWSKKALKVALGLPQGEWG